MSREKVNDKADFTQGSILGKLISFMIPILGALVLQAAYGAVDLLWWEDLERHLVFQQYRQAVRY